MNRRKRLTFWGAHEDDGAAHPLRRDVGDFGFVTLHFELVEVFNLA